MENQETNPFAEESWNESPVDGQEMSQESADYQEQQQYDDSGNEDEGYEEEEGHDDSQSYGYENELSEKIHKALLEGKHDEVYSFLDQKNRIDKLSTVEIKDRKTAEEVVKEAMRIKYSDLSADEINYKFNRQFKIPEEPKQTVMESDDEFQERLDEYKQKVQDINTELMIEAKTVRPEIAQRRAEIKLPSLDNGRPKSPEDLAQQEAYIEAYLRNAESSINDFDGLNVEYKDEGTSFTSSYNPSVEEKQDIANLMDDLASSEFDANALFAERWVNDDYTLNTRQIAEDLWFFQNKDRIVQKLVNDAVSKRITEYRRHTSNISVGGSNRSNFNPSGGQSDMDKMADHFFSN